MAAITAAWVICFILACLAWWIPPDKWWPATVAGIGYLPLLAAGIVLLVIWFLLKRVVAWFLAALLLLSFPLMRHTVALHFISPPFQWQKKGGALRVMQFNTLGPAGIDDFQQTGKKARKAFADSIELYQPDVICLQEFTETRDNENLRSNLSFVRDSLNYPYVLFQPSFYHQEPWGKTAGGLLIASRMPITNRRVSSFSGKDYPAKVVAAEIDLNGKGRINIVTTHFQSMFLHWPVNALPYPPHLQQDSAIINSTNTVAKFRHFLPRHAGQARETKNFIERLGTPIIFCADLNSVPSSWAYWHLSQNLKDAFLEKGSGLGKSYATWMPQLRIDYILMSPDFDVQQMHMLSPEISDHSAIIADLVWRK